MLKALGIGKGEIKRLYFSKYLLFSLCGGLLGLGAAAVLQGPLEGQIRELYGASDRGAQSAVSALCAVAVVEAVILLSVWRSLKKTDKLAGHLDIDVRTVINIENYKGNPKLEILFLLIRALKIAPTLQLAIYFPL